MTFLGVPGRLLAKRSWVCGRSKIAKVRGSRGRSKSAKVPSPPYPKDPPDAGAGENESWRAGPGPRSENRECIGLYDATPPGTRGDAQKAEIS